MSEDQEHELLDRDLRPFVEECDQMQGFQVITGADDAWAGFASKYLEGLRDGFGRKSVWVLGLEEARPAGRVSLTMVRCFVMIAKFIHRLGETSSTAHQYVAVLPDSRFSSLALYPTLQHPIGYLTILPESIIRLCMEHIGLASSGL